MKTYFLDTNIFLQCNVLKDLTWDQITNGDDILLLVPRAVQREIDRLKQDVNIRRSKKAKSASSLFRQIIESENTTLVIKDQNPRIEISFPPTAKIDGIYPEMLDLTRSDDCIVAEALEYISKHVGESIATITNDTGLMLTAKRCSLPYVPVPDDWLLLPETDEKDKKIASMEKTIKELQNIYPIIDITVNSKGGQTISEILVKAQHYTPLNKDELAEIVNKIKLLYPITTNFEPLYGLGSSKHYGLALVQKYSEPSSEEIRKYKEVDYPAWLEKVNEVLCNLHKTLEKPSRLSEIAISIFNNGTVSAENVKIEIRSYGGVILVPQDKKTLYHRPIKLPQPPKAPVGQPINGPMLGAVQAALAMQRQDELYAQGLQLPRPQTPRDRHKFYWKDESPAYWALVCEEFRHQDDEVNIDVMLNVPSGVDCIKGALECRVIGRNIQNPKIHTLPIIIEYEQCDTMIEAQKLLA